MMGKSVDATVTNVSSSPLVPVTVNINEDDSPRANLHNIYTRDSANEHVATVHGYGIKFRIHQGHLVIDDGIGRQRRERRYPKADRTLQRIVVTGPDGYLTLEALSWCAEHGITVTTLNPNCELTCHYATADRVTDATLLRRQVTAAGTDTGTEIARELLIRKVNGQAALLLKLFNDSNTAGQLYHYAERMAASEAVTQHQRDTASLSELEGWAGRDYFATWPGRVAVEWDARSLTRVPVNWIGYPGRSSQIAGGGKKYNASDPVNAILNYAYTLGYTEARTACIAHGLNPALGFIHADKPGRDSLALDVLETIRPDIDAYVLGLTGVGAEPRTFTYRDFTEPYGYEPGTCRIVAPLTHEIGEQSYQWRKPVMDAVETVVNILTGAHGKHGTAMPNWKLQRDTFTSVSVTPDQVIPAAVWESVFAPIVPVKPRGKGHPPVDSRVLIASMVHCDRHRKPWAHVPASFGVSHRTMTERRREWQRLGVWPVELLDVAGSLYRDHTGYCFPRVAHRAERVNSWEVRETAY